MVERTIGVEAGHRRIGRRRVSRIRRSAAALSGPLGNPFASVGARRALLPLPRRPSPASHRTFSSGLARRRRSMRSNGPGSTPRSSSMTSGNGRRRWPSDVRAGWRRLLNDPGGEIALGQNTHELDRPPAVSAARVLARRRQPPGDHRRRVPHHPPAARPARRRRHRDRQGARTPRGHARRATRSPPSTMRRPASWCRRCCSRQPKSCRTSTRSRAACTRHGATLLVDAYHHLNVVPFDVHAMGLTARLSSAVATSIASLAKATAFCACRPAASCGRSSLAGSASSRSGPRQPSGAVGYGRGARAVCRRHLRSDRRTIVRQRFLLFISACR